MPQWKRTYRAVWAANLITSVGMMSFLPFFPSLIEEMGVHDQDAVARWAGWCFAAAPLSATVTAPIWGALGDRFGRKPMVLRSMLAIALFVGAMGFAQAPWHLLVLRVLQGLFSGFIAPSITLVSVSAPAERQGRVAGDLATALAVGSLIGPLAGGFLATLLGSHSLVFFLVGFAALTGALLVAVGAEEAEGARGSLPAPGWRSALGTMGEDLRDVFAHPALRRVALLVFAMQFGIGAVNPVLELYVRALLPDGAAPGSVLAFVASLARAGGEDAVVRVQALATSLAFGGMAVASLVTLGPWGSAGDRYGHRRALQVCAGVSVASLALQAWAPVYGALVLGRVLMGVATAGVAPLAFGFAAGQTDVAHRGGAFGAVFAARTLAVAVGGTLGGILFPWLGPRGLLLMSAGVVVAASIGFALPVRGRG